MLRCSSGMEQFASFHWPNVVSLNRDKSHRPSAAVDKLDLVSATFFVNMDHGPYVSAIQFVVWRVAV